MFFIFWKIVNCLTHWNVKCEFRSGTHQLSAVSCQLTASFGVPLVPCLRCASAGNFGSVSHAGALAKAWLSATTPADAQVHRASGFPLLSLTRALSRACAWMSELGFTWFKDYQHSIKKVLALSLMTTGHANESSWFHNPANHGSDRSMPQAPFRRLIHHPLTFFILGCNLTKTKPAELYEIDPAEHPSRYFLFIFECLLTIA